MIRQHNRGRRKCTKIHDVFDDVDPGNHGVFDDDLFGWNAHGLGMYLDPDGWYFQNGRQRIATVKLESACPKTALLAMRMYRILPRHDRWGEQLRIGRWTEQSEGKLRKMSDRMGMIREFPGKGLAFGDVLRTLVGRKLAIGLTDEPKLRWHDQRDTGELIDYNRTRQLRIDIDQDRAWISEDRESVMIELRQQREIVRAFGLPYRTFRTGGRGNQIIVPLPLPAEPIVGSMISRCIRAALRARRRWPSVKVDRDTFDGLMRLPGGLHARGQIGLWIDVTNGCLYPIDQQALLMLEGLQYPSGPIPPHALGPHEFFAAQADLP